MVQFTYWVFKAQKNAVIIFNTCPFRLNKILSYRCILKAPLLRQNTDKDPNDIHVDSRFLR